MPIDRNDNMTGGATAVFDGNVNIVAMPYSKERFIQECAMTLFANTLFNDGVNIVRAANEAVSRATVLASKLTFTK